MMHSGRSRDPPPYHPGWGGLARKLVLEENTRRRRDAVRSLCLMSSRGLIARACRSKFAERLPVATRHLAVRALVRTTRMQDSKSLWRSLPDSCSRGGRSALESAPINITPRKKSAHLAVGACAPRRDIDLEQNGRLQEWSYASALTCSVSGIAWVRPDSDSRSVAQRTCWAHCRSCVRRNTWQRREQDVRRAAPKRRYSQMRRAQFDDFGAEQR